MTTMTNPRPEITSLTQEVQDTAGVIESAVVLINGIQARIDAAVAAALAANPGADLSALTTLTAQLAGERTNLANALAANPGLV